VNIERNQHDHAWSCVSVIEDMICHLLREEEIAEFRAQCYEALTAMLQHYEASVDRQSDWIRPNNN
jgi:hypothetical protein